MFMAKLIIFLFVLSTQVMYSVEDSCAVPAWETCFKLGVYPADSYYKDTCNNDRLCTKEGFTIEFVNEVIDSSLFNTKNWRKIYFKELDSMWQYNKIKYEKMRSAFKRAYLDLGNFYLKRIRPDYYTIPTRYKNTFYIEFDKNQYIDTVFDYFYEQENIKSCASPNSGIYGDLYQFDLKIENKNNYNELKIYTSPYRYVSGEINFKIFRKKSSEKYFQILATLYPKVVNPLDLVYLDSIDLIPGEKYDYKAQVCSIDEHCCGYVTEIFSAVVSGIENYSENNANGINIYPNPASNSITIITSLDLANISEVSIANILGITVFKRISDIADGKIILDVSKIPNGIYFLTVKSKDLMVSNRLEIIR